MEKNFVRYPEGMADYLGVSVSAVKRLVERWRQPDINIDIVSYEVGPRTPIVDIDDIKWAIKRNCKYGKNSIDNAPVPSTTRGPSQKTKPKRGPRRLDKIA